MIIFLLFLGTSAGILNSCDAREALLLFAYKDLLYKEGICYLYSLQICLQLVHLKNCVGGSSLARVWISQYHASRFRHFGHSLSVFGR